MAKRKRVVKKKTARVREAPQVKRLKTRVRNLMVKLSESVASAPVCS